MPIRYGSGAPLTVISINKISSFFSKYLKNYRIIYFKTILQLMTIIVITISSLNLPSTDKVNSFIEFNKNEGLGYLQVSSSKFQYDDEVYNPLITKEHGFFSTQDIETIKNIKNVLSIYPELRLQSIISIPAPENT